MKRKFILLGLIIVLCFTMLVGCKDDTVVDDNGHGTTTELDSIVIEATTETSTEDVVVEDTRPGINESIITKIEWDNAKRLAFPYTYVIGDYSYPLNLNSLPTLYITDTLTEYPNENEWTVIPISDYLRSANYSNGKGDLLCEYVEDGNTTDEHCELVAVIENPNKPKKKGSDKVYMKFHTIAIVYDDFRLNTKKYEDIPSNIYYKVSLKELEKNGIYNKCGSDETKINSSVDAINDLIVNYLGMPSNIYSTVPYSELDTNANQSFIIEWLYDDGSRCTLTVSEYNTNLDKKKDNDAGIEFTVDSLYFYGNGELLTQKYTHEKVVPEEYKYNIINDIK